MGTTKHDAEKLAYWRSWQAVTAHAVPDWLEALRNVYHTDVAWHGPHPLNDCSGIDAVLQRVWQPLLQACPDLERRDDILIAGEFNGGCWVAATGHFTGNLMHSWLGIPATGGVVNIRYGEFSRMERGRVREVYVIFDLLDLMRQAGTWPLGKVRGSTERVPGPATQDGLQLAPNEASESQRSLSLVEAMIAGLMQYDGKNLASMGMERFWQPHFNWYGPAGIGTSRGLSGFQTVHQAPFLAAFPDRVGGNHKARFGDGHYVASTGWPSITATYSGTEWVGQSANPRRISMRVMDFWRRDGAALVDNWVFIDIVELLLQLGITVPLKLS
jgi:predicted ester cyclase